MQVTTSGLVKVLTDTARLESLYTADFLDTPDEKAFDRITGMVRHFLGVPVSLVTFVDADRQYFKSQSGLPSEVAKARQTPLTHSICQHVIARKNVVAIDDAAGNKLTCDNMAVSELGVMAYLGAPLINEGEVIGALCAIDIAPRQWTDANIALLENMAHFTMLEIAVRNKIGRKVIRARTP